MNMTRAEAAAKIAHIRDDKNFVYGPKQIEAMDMAMAALRADMLSDVAVKIVQLLLCGRKYWIKVFHGGQVPRLHGESQVAQHLLVLAESDLAARRRGAEQAAPPADRPRRRHSCCDGRFCRARRPLPLRLAVLVAARLLSTSLPVSSVALARTPAFGALVVWA